MDSKEELKQQKKEEIIEDSDLKNDKCDNTEDKKEPNEKKEESIEEKYKDLEKKLEEEKNNFLRKIAEYENIRKRNNKEKEEFLKYANEKLITKILEISDNLNRAIVSSKESQDFKALAKGVKMISDQFEKIFKDEGVKAIKCVGLEYDPYKHQAMMQEESDKPENTVLEELQKGYTLKGKVIRPSLVKISKK